MFFLDLLTLYDFLDIQFTVFTTPMVTILQKYISHGLRLQDQER